MHVTDRELVSTLPETIDGTQLQAAVYARFATAASAAHWLGWIGNYLIVRPAARAKAHRIAEETDVPLDAAVVFAVSGADLHVWKADPMLSQVHGHLGSVPLGRVAGARVGGGDSWAPLTIELDGGESIECEARGEVRQFVDAIGRREETAAP